jgi:disulfide bond formation protein DsbB
VGKNFILFYFILFYFILFYFIILYYIQMEKIIIIIIGVVIFSVLISSAVGIYFITTSTKKSTDTPTKKSTDTPSDKLTDTPSYELTDTPSDNKSTCNVDSCNNTMSDWINTKYWAFADTANTFGECKGCNSKWFKAPFQTSNNGNTWNNNTDRMSAYNSVKV